MVVALLLVVSLLLTLQSAMVWPATPRPLCNHYHRQQPSPVKMTMRKKPLVSLQLNNHRLRHPSPHGQLRLHPKLPLSSAFSSSSSPFSSSSSSSSGPCLPPPRHRDHDFYSCPRLFRGKEPLVDAPGRKKTSRRSNLLRVRAHDGLTCEEQLERQVAKSKIVQFIVDRWNESSSRGATELAENEGEVSMTTEAEPIPTEAETISDDDDDERFYTRKAGINSDELTDIAKRLEKVNPNVDPVSQTEMMSGVWRLVHVNLPKLRYLVDWGCFQTLDMESKDLKGLLIIRPQWPRVTVQTVGKIVVDDVGKVEESVYDEDHDSSDKDDGGALDEDRKREQRGSVGSVPSRTQGFSVNYESIQLGPVKSDIQDGKILLTKDLGISTRMISLFKETNVTYLDRHLRITRNNEGLQCIWLAIDRFALDQRMVKTKLMEALTEYGTKNYDKLDYETGEEIESQASNERIENSDVEKDREEGEENNLSNEKMRQKDQDDIYIRNLVASLEDVSAQVVDFSSWVLAQGRWSLLYSTIPQLQNPRFVGWKQTEGALILQEDKLAGLPPFWIEDLGDEKEEAQIILNNVVPKITAKATRTNKEGKQRRIFQFGRNSIPDLNSRPEDGKDVTVEIVTEQTLNVAASALLNYTESPSASLEGLPEELPEIFQYPYARTTFLDKDTRVLRTGQDFQEIIILKRISNARLFETYGKGLVSRPKAKLKMKVDVEEDPEVTKANDSEASLEEDLSGEESAEADATEKIQSASKNPRPKLKKEGGGIVAKSVQEEQSTLKKVVDSQSNQITKKKRKVEPARDGVWKEVEGALIMAENVSGEPRMTQEIWAPTKDWEDAGGAKIFRGQANQQGEILTLGGEDLGGAIVWREPKQEILPQLEDSDWEKVEGALIFKGSSIDSDTLTGDAQIPQEEEGENVEESENLEESENFRSNQEEAGEYVEDSENLRSNQQGDDEDTLDEGNGSQGSKIANKPES